MTRAFSVAALVGLFVTIWAPDHRLEAFLTTVVLAFVAALLFGRDEQRRRGPQDGAR